MLRVQMSVVFLLRVALASMALATMVNNLGIDILEQQLPLPSVEALMPLGLGMLLVLLLLPHMQKVASSSSSVTLPVDPVGTGIGISKAPVFGLVPQDCPTPFLHANDDQLAWFCDFAQRINDMRHGIFMEAGNVAEGQQPGWTAEAFKSALLNLRKRMPKQAWPHGGRLHEPLDDIALASRLIAADLNVDEAARLVRDYATFRQVTVNGGGVAPTREWLERGIVFVPCEDFLAGPWSTFDFATTDQAIQISFGLVCGAHSML